MFKYNLRVSILMLGFLLWASPTIFGQTTAFTYQGKLTDTGNPASGQYDFQIKLFDTQTVGTGTQLGTTLTVSNVTVTAGIFTVQLDFGACASCFNGSVRFLEIAVKPTSGPTFTTLGTRQPVTSDPYAIRSLNAGNATTADGLSGVCASCVTSSQIGSVNGSAVTGTIPLASVPSGSANYIQNTTSPQSSSNFNISGNGTAGGTVSANVVNAAMQYNIGGSRVLSAAGTNNLFAGVGAGSVMNTGVSNSFFGSAAGNLNTSGSGNAFFGDFAGNRNTTANNNSFFGSFSGTDNTTGFNNSFFGQFAGIDNSSGNGNAFFGISAGEHNSTGNGNVFFGPLAGDTNTTGGINTAIGNLADVGSGNLFNATAIGGNSLVSQSNSLVLGSINGVNNASTDTKVGIGTTAPQFQLDVVSNQATADGLAITHFGNDTILIGQSANGTRTAPTATGTNDALLDLQGRGFDGSNFVTGRRASVLMTATQPWTNTANGTKIQFLTTANNTTSPVIRATIDQDGQVGVGTTNPGKHLHVAGSGDQEIMIESTDTGGIQWSLQSSMGANNGRFEIIDRTANASRMTILNSGNVGVGTTAPADRLHVNGIIRVATLGVADTTTTLCRNSSNQIAACNTSSLRYKTDIQPFTGGLDIVKRLRPISFTWKQGGSRDLGFGAEDVATVEPLLTFTNEKGQIEGVKYDRINVALVNAIKEQQAQIEQEQVQRQQEQAEIRQEQAQIKTQATEIQREEQEIRQQQLVIRTLMKLVCADHRHAHICK